MYFSYSLDVDSEAEVDQIGLNKAIPEEAVVCALPHRNIGGSFTTPTKMPILHW
jgi:hypothetical protein